jgi:hypothetical protein
VATSFSSRREATARHPLLELPFIPFGGTLTVRLLEVLVSPQGEATVQTRGYSGADCLQASKFLEQALGVSTTDRKTAEYYQPTPIEHQIQQ